MKVTLFHFSPIKNNIYAQDNIRLLCSNVTEKNNVIKAYVINGAWDMKFNKTTNIMHVEGHGKQTAYLSKQIPIETNKSFRETETDYNTIMEQYEN